MNNLIGKKVITIDGQHSGIVIKHFKPTGRSMTVHIKQDDGRIETQYQIQFLPPSPYKIL